MTRFDRSAVDALSSFVRGEFDYDLSGGQHLRVLAAPLPDRAVVGAGIDGDTLWIIIDIRKPESRGHLLGLMDFLAQLGELPAMDEVIRDGTAFPPGVINPGGNGVVVYHVPSPPTGGHPHPGGDTSQ